MHNSADGKAVFANNFNPDGFAFYAQGGKNYFENNVGIGVMNPWAKLHIQDPDICSLLLRTSNDPSAYAGIKLETGGTSRAWVANVDSSLGFFDNTLTILKESSQDAICIQVGLLGVPEIMVKEGKVGIGTNNPTVALDVVGDIKKTGTNGFVQDLPNDPSKEIVYVSLEGPEAGTYIRGTAELVDGEAVVNLPEHFSLVTSDEGLTVQLTPVGEWLQLYVVEKGTQRIVVREANSKNGQFDYLVQGVRKGYENYQVIRDKE